MCDAQLVQGHESAGDVGGVEGRSLLWHATGERLDEGEEVAAQRRVGDHVHKVAVLELGDEAEQERVLGDEQHRPLRQHLLHLR